MKTIVVLVDFSDLTFKVLKQAHALAKAFDSQVILLHVMPDAVVLDIGSALAEAAAEKVRQEHQMQLKELEESLSKFGVNVISEELHGPTVEKIVEETKRLKADLIIMGTHGHGALYKFIVGSTIEEIVKSAKCPVLVVPG